MKKCTKLRQIHKTYETVYSRSPLKNPFPYLLILALLLMLLSLVTSQMTSSLEM